MYKKLFAVIATLAVLASAPARADSFYFGFASNQHAPQHVYVAPRHYEPVYVPAPRVVYYNPRPAFISYTPAPHWKGCKKWHRHKGKDYHRGHYRDHNDDHGHDDDYRGNQRGGHGRYIGY